MNLPNEENIAFAMHIETIVKDMRLSYIEAIVHYCNENDIEVEIIPKLIPGALLSKIKCEAQALNLIPKSTTRKLTL